jgi:hypothetical protein
VFPTKNRKNYQKTKQGKFEHPHTGSPDPRTCSDGSFISHAPVWKRALIFAASVMLSTWNKSVISASCSALRTKCRCGENNERLRERNLQRVCVAAPKKCLQSFRIDVRTCAVLAQAHTEPLSLSGGRGRGRGRGTQTGTETGRDRQGQKQAETDRGKRDGRTETEGKKPGYALPQVQVSGQRRRQRP